MTYKPKPIDTSKIKLPDELITLTERLAEHNHDIWAAQRIKEGWTYGTARNDEKKEHPDLVPYDKLPESEKEYDRKTAMEALKAIISMGFKIEKVK
jgi:hypothetical protein